MNDDEDQRRITYTLSTKEAHCILFEIKHEDHTLGNLLSEQLLQSPNVRFAGYRIEHPLKDIIKIRIQKDSPVPITHPKDYIKEAVDELTLMIDRLSQSFREQVSEQR